MGSSFYRQTFLVDKVFMSFAFIGGSMMTIVGILVGGRLVNRLGRKRLTVISSFLFGAMTLSFINIPNLWLSLLVFIINGVFMGIFNTAYGSLALEQAPDNRGTMMSLSGVSMYCSYSHWHCISRNASPCFQLSSSESNGNIFFHRSNHLPLLHNRSH